MSDCNSQFTVSQSEDLADAAKVMKESNSLISRGKSQLSLRGIHPDSVKVLILNPELCTYRV